MAKTPTKVQFTVGKLDAGMAILLTEDHHQIEFPSILLPKTVTTGSIIDLSVTQNPAQEEVVHAKFLDLQATIRSAFASGSPSTPRLALRNATQTSAVLEWDPIDIATAEMKSLTLWRDGTRLGNIPKPLTTTTTKLSGLSIDTDYTFQLILRTTAGTYASNPLKVRTHKMSNLSGITVCAGTLPPDHLDRLSTAIAAIGAKSLQKRVRIDTTHFICSVPEGDEWQRARDMNIPIVVVDWIEACQREGKVVGVRAYYLDADPALRRQMVNSPTPTQARSSIGAGVETPRKEELHAAGRSSAGVGQQHGEAASKAPEDHAPPAVPKKEIPTHVESLEKVAEETPDASVVPKEQPPTEVAEEEGAPKETGEEKFDDVPI